MIQELVCECVVEDGTAPRGADYCWVQGDSCNMVEEALRLDVVDAMHQSYARTLVDNCTAHWRVIQSCVDWFGRRQRGLGLRHSTDRPVLLGMSPVRRLGTAAETMDSDHWVWVETPQRDTYHVHLPTTRIFDVHQFVA